MEVPGYKSNDAKGGNNEEHEDKNKRSSTQCGGLCVTGAQCVVVMVMNFDRTVSTRIRWGVCFYDDTGRFAGLQLLALEVCKAKLTVLTAMLCEEEWMYVFFLWRRRTMLSRLRERVRSTPPGRPRDPLPYHDVLRTQNLVIMLLAAILDK